MRGAQRNSSTPSVWLQEASRIRVCQTTRQHSESARDRVVCSELGTSKSDRKRWKEGFFGARRPDLILEDKVKKTILLIDMAFPKESNKEAKREEKIRKYQQLCFELRERREGYTVKVIPMIIGCLRGGMKELKVNMKQIFDNGNDKEIELIARDAKDSTVGERIRY